MRHKRSRGFALIEALILICILGIIVALASGAYIEDGTGQAVGRIVSVQTASSGEYRITLASGSTAGFSWSRDFYTENSALAEKAKSCMLQQRMVLVEFWRTPFVGRIASLKLLKG